MKKKELKRELKVTRILLDAQIKIVSDLTKTSLDLKQQLYEANIKMAKLNDNTLHHS